MESHHGVRSAWMGANVPGYAAEDAPAVVMSTEAHNTTRAGGEPSDDPAFFEPLHVKHLAEWCPDVIPHLQLPPGVDSSSLLATKTSGTIPACWLPTAIAMSESKAARSAS